MRPIPLTSTSQPDVQVQAPPHIRAVASPYEYDHRITMVTFTNEGNHGAPKQLQQAALVPVGIEAHVLRMMGTVTIYSIFADSMIEKIFVTLGTQNIGDQSVDVLVALIDLMSHQEGAHHITHGCSVFD